MTTIRAAFSPRARVASYRPTAWYRFGVGLTSSAGKVSQWNDVTSNVNHLVQATGGNQPALQTDGSLLFDGSASFMKAVTFTLAQPTMVYLLFRFVTWNSGNVVCDGNSAQTGQIIMTTSSPQLNIMAGSSVAANTGLAVNAYGAIAVVFSGTASSSMINKKGPITGNAGTGSMSGFVLGADGGSTNFANIQVKEAILFNVAHDLTKQYAVVNYLSSVGGLGL
jgi:hypothetical protein